jgi:hypothetical protein
MSALNNSLLLGADAATTYQISRSLRFNSADSAYLNRTPGSAGDRNKWTFSCWVKLGAGLANNIFSVFTANSGNTGLIIRSGSVGSPYQIEFFTQSGATVPLDLITTRVFRDYGAWFHLLFYFDLANSTQADRAQIYINGVRETNFSTNTNTISTSSVGRDINNTSEHRIGAGNGYADGYLADVHFIDGSALDPTSFTETDAITGQLIPKAFSGSYGTNGFRLTFSDNSGTTATTLGKDAAGSNNWTPNNFSVASGAGNDSLVDSPTGYGTDTGAGGEVRGSYCTWNPLNRSRLGDGTTTTNTLSNGNLDVSFRNAACLGTLGVSSGKWYWEITPISAPVSTQTIVLGVASGSFNVGGAYPRYVGQDATSWGYVGYTGNLANNGSNSAWGNAFTSGDVIGVALDCDNGKLFFSKNGVWQNSGNPSTGANPASSALTAGPYFPAVTDGGGPTEITCSSNWGARPFAYTAPSGYKALCSHNLPEPTILKGNTAMDVKLYTGNGSSQTVSGLAFSPDLVWGKNRSSAFSHELYDTVRGAQNLLRSNLDAAEFNDSTLLTAFTSDGFTVGSNGGMNGNTNAIVAWAWDCGSSTVTNTSGTISSQVRASATNGCSVVTYTGTGSNATVGHGLGAAPKMIIVKSRSNGGASYYWAVYNEFIGAGNALELDSTTGSFSASLLWNSTAPTSSVFSIGTNVAVNGSTATYVAYCFAPVAGFSAFGSYTGNGSSDGPFVFTGFRPRWIMIKRTDSGSNWYMIDALRSPYNEVNDLLYAEQSLAEGTDDTNNGIDFLSNGFKLRKGVGGTNVSNATLIYAAFAEAPLKYSRAR